MAVIKWLRRTWLHLLCVLPPRLADLLITLTRSDPSHDKGVDEVRCYLLMLTFQAWQRQVAARAGQAPSPCRCPEDHAMTSSQDQP